MKITNRNPAGSFVLYELGEILQTNFIKGKVWNEVEGSVSVENKRQRNQEQNA